MESRFLIRHPGMINVIYLLLLYVLPQTLLISAKGIMLFAVIIMTLLSYFTYMIIRQTQYAAIYSPERANRYFTIDMTCVFVGMTFYLFAFNWYVNKGPGYMGAFVGSLGCLFGVAMLLRNEDIGRYAKLDKNQKKITNQLSKFLEQLNTIPTLWIVYASPLSEESEDYIAYFELYGKSNFVLRFQQGFYTIDFVRNGIFMEYEVPVGYAIDTYLNNKVGKPEQYHYKTEGEVIDLLIRSGGLVQRLLEEKRIYKIYNNM